MMTVSLLLTVSPGILAANQNPSASFPFITFHPIGHGWRE